MVMAYLVNHQQSEAIEKLGICPGSPCQAFPFLRLKVQ